MGLSEGQTDGGRERGERLGTGLEPAKGRARRRARYLPTWGCRCLRLSEGLGVASVRVAGWLRT